MIPLSQSLSGSIRKLGWRMALLCGVVLAGLVAAGFFVMAFFLWVEAKTDLLTAALSTGGALLGIALLGIVAVCLLTPQKQPPETKADASVTGVLEELLYKKLAGRVTASPRNLLIATAIGVAAGLLLDNPEEKPD